MMHSVALMKDGSIVTIVATSRTLADTAARWPEYDAVALDDVPLETKQKYEFWTERP